MQEDDRMLYYPLVMVDGRWEPIGGSVSFNDAVLMPCRCGRIPKAYHDKYKLQHVVECECGAAIRVRDELMEIAGWTFRDIVRMWNARM